MGEEVNIVKKIIRNWPAYRKFVERKGINASEITSISELPLLDKEFLSLAIYSVPIFKIHHIIPSSGSTGDDFSFGFFGRNELEESSTEIDSFLDERFNISNNKTLLLNMLPGAISLQSSKVSVASIGVRMDTAISAIKSFGTCFDQLILVGEPLFIKNLIELGCKESILWKYIPLFVIVGGEWISESYRNYLESIIGYNRIYSSLGMAELGLNYFYETQETIILRRLLFDNRQLVQDLFGEPEFCPMIFNYSEDRIFIETLAEPSDALNTILLTTMDANRALPLIRYKCGDKGRILSRDDVNHALETLGYGALFDESGPPLLAHFGRGKCVCSVYPERVKEILFKDLQIASTTTGNFMLYEEDNYVQLEVQLKESVHRSRDLEGIYREAFQELGVQVKLYPFMKYPRSLDYERKVRYVSESNCGQNRRREKCELSNAL
jgi:phenylacetate-coenzyme A ligase PaaK-like adenylate-forming protein